MTNTHKLFSSFFIITFFTACNNEDTNKLNTTKTFEKITEKEIDLSKYSKQKLTSKQKYSLSYMWNEEKLAKYLYLEASQIYDLDIFKNISTNCEERHVNIIEDIIEWYDLDITDIPDYFRKYSKKELNKLNTGTFAIPELQNLYNSLYTQVNNNKIDALKVGCEVEVKDIDDLKKYLLFSDGNKVLEDAFFILLQDSYKHYWMFDGKLKDLGLNQGCCSFSKDICKPEYPKN